MRPIDLPRRLLGSALLVALPLSAPAAQQSIPTPRQAFGFELGADYQLVTYSQLHGFWETLAQRSDRMLLDTIGKTAEGRPQVMAIITSPANHRALDRYREIARRLALAEGVSEEEARALAAEGKAVVWIDGGLHATEVLGAQQLLELVHRMTTGQDAETQRILDDVILLAVHANPDGHALVADWYLREKEPTQRFSGNIPRLYQKYVGHDNNRDFYMSSQPETENMNRVMYREWFPQIVFNHHQTGPAGTVMFAPPFRDPLNYVYDPLITTGIDLIGAAMHGRFAREGKPGVTMRSGARYSTWWNGGLRTMPYFHNMIGLLTETIGNPTPMEIPFVPDRLLVSSDLPNPIHPQRWHFRQSMDYSWTANRAVLDVASRYREIFLYNIYRMGKNAIERGSRDHWTFQPDEVDAMRAKLDSTTRQRADDGDSRVRRQASAEQFRAMLTPESRDPRGYIIPSDQDDFLTAIKFIAALQETGVAVHRATRDFAVAGKRYPAGSFVVKTAQAFRPHVLDMFEPQDHPQDFRYEGGPPIPPYDNAGWTLALQMGVEFDRILDGFDGPFVRLDSIVAPAPGRVADAGAGGWLIDHQLNDAFAAVNRLLAAGHEVYWLTEPARAGSAAIEAGTFFVPGSRGAREVLQQAATATGLAADPVSSRPSGSALKLRQPRIGLWDRYGGSMPSGWTRWILEQFGFPYRVVYPRDLDAGNLRAKYDVLVFVDGAITARGTGDGDDRTPADATLPEAYRGRGGRVTVEKTVPALREFLRAGGTILAIGSSVALARHLDLPVADALVERSPRGEIAPLPREKFFIPGSLLEVRIDSLTPLAHGMDGRAIVMFDHSPVLTLPPAAAAMGIRPVAWFDSARPLRSGWAWGESYLEGGVAVAEAPVGRGRLFLFGPEIAFRAQAHGTFKLLFNGLQLSAAEQVQLGTAKDVRAAAEP